MKSVLRKVIVFSAAIGMTGSIVFSANETCRALLEDERVQLADLALEVRLAQARLDAFEEIFGLIDGLWQNEAIERMVWLEAKYDRDAARISRDRAGLIVKRQQALIDRLADTCGGKSGAPAHKRNRYRSIQCEQLGRAVEQARIDLEFQQEWLTSVRKLREGSTATATAQDVILARLEVTLEQIRLEDAQGRLKACRKELPGEQ